MGLVKLRNIDICVDKGDTEIRSGLLGGLINSALEALLLLEPQLLCEARISVA